MNINLGLITIGNGNWKDMLKQMWNSLEIQDTGYKLMRAKDEYEYKLQMHNKELPSFMTNYDLHVQNDNTLKIVISMPVIENCEYNNDMVMLPWYDEEFKYAEASRICAEKIVDRDYVDYVVILCGDNLTESEKDFIKAITRLCVVKDKYFWKIGNSCECFNIDNLVQWINDKENCSSYFKDTVNIIGV